MPQFLTFQRFSGRSQFILNNLIRLIRPPDWASIQRLRRLRLAHRDLHKLKTYWFAVQTRPRAESAALADINSMSGLQAYLPQETRLRRTRKGRVTVQHPLMPGFIFVGSTTPPIVDAASPDHPHPIFQVLKSRAVRCLVRSGAGGVHPIRPQMIDGWRVEVVDYLRQREAAGAFDFRPPAPRTPERKFMKGALKDQLTTVMARLFPDLAPALAA